MNAVIYMWTASQRCGEKDSAAKCEVDVASAIDSVTNVAGSVVKVVQGCGVALEGTEQRCGMAVNKLTGGAAGLAAASGGIADTCPKAVQKKDQDLHRTQ